MIAVIGMPTTAAAVTWIDGKYIKQGTVKAKQLDPIQRSEAYSSGVESADLPLGSSPESVAWNEVAAGTYLVQAQVAISNYSGSNQAAACYLDYDGAEPVTFRGLDSGAVIAHGEVAVINVLKTARVPEPDLVMLKCMTFGNPASVEMESSFLVFERIGKISYLPLA